MRLLDARSLKYQDFPDESCLPEYAILSHTWVNKQEVSLQDMISPYQSEKSGFDKIRYTCRLARDRGLDWVWVDTCCIDKTSSTELTEAINSMFRWYQLAQVCFVYLADFTRTPQQQLQVPGAPADADDLSGGVLSRADTQNIEKCAWFTRGWTLQELLAPSYVEFYDTTWSFIGTRSQMCRLVSHITRIPEEAINGDVDLSYYSIAQRMAWASSRVTTKVEDAAYCLLGLFDVNMPLIYGEGQRSFERLQDEILKTTTDFTIFGWMPQPDVNYGAPPATPGMPLLASSPRQYQACYDLEQFHNDDSEMVITNRGLRVTTYLVLIPLHGLDNVSQHSLSDEQSADVLQSHPKAGTVPSLHYHPSSSSDVGRAGNGRNTGFADESHANLSMSTTSSSLSRDTSSASAIHKASDTSPRPPYRYVLAIGKKRSARLHKAKKTHETVEIGISLRFTGPGQLIREGNQPLEVLPRDKLQNFFKTTESFTFYITLQPNGVGKRSMLADRKSIASSHSPQTSVAVRGGPTLVVPQDAYSGQSSMTTGAAGGAHQVGHRWNQDAVAKYSPSSGLLPSPVSPETPDPRSKNAAASYHPSSNLLPSPVSPGTPDPHNKNAAAPYHPSSGLLPSPVSPGTSDPHADFRGPPVAPVRPSPAPEVHKYSPQHPLRIFYHPRLLRGVYIPPLDDRGIAFGHLSHQQFDERLRIFCAPESESDVVVLSCKSLNAIGPGHRDVDSLTFNVLVDFRSRSPRCLVIDRSTVQDQFLLALSMRSHGMVPISWYMVQTELPEVMSMTNRLRIKVANSERTYEVVATIDKGPVTIDDYTLKMNTLDIKVARANGSGKEWE